MFGSENVTPADDPPAGSHDRLLVDVGLLDDGLAAGRHDGPFIHVGVLDDGPPAGPP